MSNPRVTILGGGLAGLSAAHYLLKAAKYDVLLLEKTRVLGGWVQTVKDPITGVILEQGPHTIRARGIPALNTLSLVDELNLSNQVRAVDANHPGASNRLICVDNQLHSLPTKLSSIFKKTTPFSKPLIFACLNLLFGHTKKCRDESIYSFAERRFNKEIAEYLISPMICGICAGDSKEISVKFLLSDIFEAEQKHGSLVKGIWKEKLLRKANPDLVNNSNLCRKAQEENWSVWTFRNGMKSLVDGLENSVIEKGGTIIPNMNVTKINFFKDSTLCHFNGYAHETSHIISALPAKSLAPLLKDEHPELSKELLNIPYVSVAVVNLVYEGNKLKHNAFGFLVPPSQKIPILGMIFDSCVFSQGEKTILTAMIGGSWFNDHLGENPTDDEILIKVLKQVKNILNISEYPDSYNISILRDCIPQYVIGHHERIKNINQYIKTKKLRLSLIGSAYSGVGVNDVILSGKNVASLLK